MKKKSTQRKYFVCQCCQWIWNKWSKRTRLQFATCFSLITKNVEVDIFHFVREFLFWRFFETNGMNFDDFSTQIKNFATVDLIFWPHAKIVNLKNFKSDLNYFMCPTSSPARILSICDPRNNLKLHFKKLFSI